VAFREQTMSEPSDREAFGRLASVMQPRMVQCCKAHGVQDADAEDLVANLMLRFFERDVFARLVFEREEKFYAWIRTVSSRAVYSFMRARLRKPGNWSAGTDASRVALDQLPAAMADGLSTICDEERALARQARARVEQRLSAPTRQGFQMLVDQGVSVEEVGRTLGMTHFAVWKLRSRVLAMIRKELCKLQKP
jgi:RNA polymerase sigma factor (sigma-70 family)